MVFFFSKCIIVSDGSFFNTFITVTDLLQNVIAQAVYLEPNHKQTAERNRIVGSQPNFWFGLVWFGLVWFGTIVALSVRSKLFHLHKMLKMKSFFYFYESY